MQSLQDKNKESTKNCLTHALLNHNKSSLRNSENQDQMASDKAIWSGSALLSMQPQNEAIVPFKPWGYKTFFLLNSTEHELSAAHKN